MKHIENENYGLKVHSFHLHSLNFAYMVKENVQNKGNSNSVLIVNV